MDSIKQQKLHALSKFKRCHSVKRAFHILLSISIFSLFLTSYPSSWPPTNPNSLKPFMSEFISNHLSLEVNRNIMFLLCNFILLFVTGGFGFFRASSNGVDDLHGEYLAMSAAQHRPVPIEDKEVIVESMVLAENGITDKEVIVTDAEEEEAAGAGSSKENNYHQHHLYQHHQTHNHHRRSRPHDHHHHHQRHGCQYRRQHRKQQQQRHHPQLRQPQEEEEEKGQKNYYRQQQERDQLGGLVIVEEEKGQENYYRQQQERDQLGGLVIVEESDERFDNFIKQVKEGMRMEARKLLRTA